MSDDGEENLNEIDEIRCYEVRIGDWLLSINASPNSDRVELNLSWKDKGNVKHFNYVDKRQFQKILRGIVK
jgi:hypothetical protein